MIRHRRRPADGAEEDGVIAELCLPVVRHHLARAARSSRSWRSRVIAFEVKPKSRAAFEDAHAFGHDFLADAVTGDDGDAVFAHLASFQN